MSKVLELERDVRRARMGARFLDRTLGPDWRKLIRRSRLNMGRGLYPRVKLGKGGCGCVLAQLDAYLNDKQRGEYQEMREKLGLLQHPRIDQAFSGAVSTEAWKRVLRESA